MWKESQSCGLFNKLGLGYLPYFICSPCIWAQFRVLSVHSEKPICTLSLKRFTHHCLWNISNVCLSLIVPCHHTCHLLYTPSHTLSSTSDKEENKIFPVQGGNLSVLVADHVLVRFQPCLNKLFPVQYCSFTHRCRNFSQNLSLCLHIYLCLAVARFSLTDQNLCQYFPLGRLPIKHCTTAGPFYLQIVHNCWTFLSISRLCTTAGPFSLSPDCAQLLDLSLSRLCTTAGPFSLSPDCAQLLDLFLCLQIVHNCWTFLSPDCAQLLDLSISRLCTTAGPFSLSPDCAQLLDLFLCLQIVHNCWTFLSPNWSLSFIHMQLGSSLSQTKASVKAFLLIFTSNTAVNIYLKKKEKKRKEGSFYWLRLYTKINKLKPRKKKEKK